MKKVFILGLIITLANLSTSAQNRPVDRIQKFRMERGFNRGQITRPERFHLRKDQFRYKIAQRRVRRDGTVTPMERRRLMMMKRHNRQEMFRFKHNRFRRVI
jgi:hypothetical protein